MLAILGALAWVLHSCAEEPVASGTVSFWKNQKTIRLETTSNDLADLCDSAISPYVALRKLNEWLANHEKAKKGSSFRKRKTTRRLIWKFCPYLKKPLSSLLWDMWIFVIKERLFPMVPWSPLRRLLVWLETVFLFRPIGKNTSSFVRESQDLVCLWSSLTDQQKA